jgi:S1-C subfamily serine protease
VKKGTRFISLLLCFVFTVSCCFVKVPPIINNQIIDIAKEVPIDPGAVLFVAGMDMMRGQPMSGSAVVIESDLAGSWALSAGHVCYPEPDPHALNIEDWMMIALDVDGKVMPMNIVALDMTNDVCVFRIPSYPMPSVPLASEQIEIGERAFLGAYPGGMYEPGFVPLFEGFYSGELTVEDKKWSGFTIPVAPGSSGGGVVNEKGELIGIISMAVSNFENITLAAKLENIQNLLDVAKRNPNRLTILH